MEGVVFVRKKLIAFLLSLALLTSIPSLSQADDSIPVLLNGEAIHFEVQPFIEEGTTMVPFRSIFEKLGLAVSWDGEAQTITGYSSDLEIRLQIGSATAIVDGKPQELTIAPEIKDGSTFVPLRFIGESSGKKVIWDARNHTVLIRDGLSNYLENTLYITSKNLTYVGDQKDGHVSIYSDGKLVFEGEFKDYKINGTGTLYWQGGQKYYEGQWFNGLMNGIGKLYNEDGTLWYDQIKMSDNIIGGNGSFYLSNGWVYKGELVNGTATGIGKYYDPSGALFFEGESKNFKFEGQGKIYFTDGKVLFVGEFHNSMANGEGIQYNEDGSIKFKGLFKDGNPVIDKVATQEIGINFSAEPPVLDSSIATANAAFTMINAFNEGLYRLDKDGKVQPGLAKEMPKITNNGLTYTIALRDAKWSDGTSVKAADFVNAWKRTLDPATKAQYSFLLERIKGGEDVTKAKTPNAVKKAKDSLGLKAIDDNTLEINLERPVAYFPSLLAFPVFFPQKMDFVAALGNQYGTDADKVIGAGPFKLVKWNHGQTLEFVKNDNYWDAMNVKLNKITVYIVKDGSTGLNLYASNVADVSELGADFLNLYQGKPDIVFKPELTTSYLMFQEKKFPAFANAKVRQALTLAIDRYAFIKKVLNNGSAPSTGFVPNGTLDGNNQSFRAVAGDLTEPKFDTVKAKQLFAEGLQELGMTSLPSFKLTSDDTVTAKKTLEFIQAQWKTNLGIDMTPDPILHMNRVEKQSKHDFDAVVALWGADYNDPMTFLDMWGTGGEFNEVDWSNAQYDELVSSARNETDPETRSKLLVDAEKILMQEMPVGPLYFRNRIFVRKPNVEGIFFPSFGVEWELKWASVK
ncbi:hypothetical protein ASG93_01230 [Paenibacillus sp. Soil787]|nr:hypothetical protein ASG93_01230 [Paenibacillus sp. Soil787]